MTSTITLYLLASQCSVLWVTSLDLVLSQFLIHIEPIQYKAVAFLIGA